MSKNYNIPIFIPEAACPSKCIYCDQKVITGKKKLPTKEDIISEIEKRTKTFSKPAHIELAFFGGNFTGLNLEEQEYYLKIGLEFFEKGIINGIRISTRPDYINEEILRFLKNYPLETIEIGAQSFDDQVLIACGRKYGSLEIYRACKFIRSFGFKLGVQIMLGLPESNKDKELLSVEQAINLGAAELRIYPLLILKNSEIEKLYAKGEYMPLTLNETIERVKEIILLAEQSNVAIIKVGLQITDELKRNFVAGPLFPSIREMAISEIWLDIFRKYNFHLSKKNVKIVVSPSQINYAIGYKKKNKQFLLSLFKDVKFITDEKLKEREFYVLYY